MASIDERHDALRKSVELLLLESREHTKQIDKLTALVTIDAENIERWPVSLKRSKLDAPVPDSI